jgi:alpha-L-rhamnosidase
MMKQYLFALSWFLFLNSACLQTKVSKIEVEDLMVESLNNPSGIDSEQPRLSWQIESNESNVFQSSYEIRVGLDSAQLSHNNKLVWQTGRVSSNESLQIVYKGETLQSGQKYYWQVRLWDNKGASTEWSVPANFSTGLFKKADWKEAAWIAWKPQEGWKAEWDERKKAEFAAPSREGDGFPFKTQSRMSLWDLYSFHERPYDPAPLLRKEFVLAKPMKRAMIYISGLGHYELRLNGQRVGDHQLDPAWTDYTKRVFYSTYDVTRQLNTGENAVGVMLGRGFYGLLSNDAWNTEQTIWLGQPKMIFRLSVEYNDGTYENVVSDLSWKVTGGPVVYDCPRRGEIYDARLEQKGWDTSGYNDFKWTPVNYALAPQGSLRAQIMPPIKATRTVRPISLSEPKPGVFVYDLGENITGWARVRLRGPAGTRILVRYAEKKDREDFFCSNIAMFQEDAYVLDGTERVLEPRFTYKAFRYVQIAGSTIPLKPEDLEAIHVHTDLESTGEFSCSDPLVNQIYAAIKLTQLNNTHGLPTDCPHREKQGWMGDGMLGAEAAFWMFDMSSLYTKWVQDMADGQHPNGQLSVFAPTSKIQGQPFTTYAQGLSPIWASAFPEIVWRLYIQYGDKRILELNYEAMKRLAESLRQQELKGRPFIVFDAHNDWIPPDIQGSRPPEDAAIYGTAYYYHIVDMCGRVAKVLKREEELQQFKIWSNKIREAFDREFYDSINNQYCAQGQSSYRQSANAIPLHFGMVTEEHRESVVKNLIKDIRDRGWQLNTGIIGTRSLMEVLPSLGNEGVEAYWKLLTRTDYPSWGYMMRNNATTIWERWQGDSSLDHPAFGSVGGSFFRYLAGIQPSESHPGFEEFDVKPVIPEGLTWVKASYHSVRGDIKVEWKRVADQLSIQVWVPAGTKARIHVPSAAPLKITEERCRIQASHILPDMAIFEVHGGEYSFNTTISQETLKNANSSLNTLTALDFTTQSVPQDMKPSTVVLEGRFGRAEINTDHPGLTELTLRSTDGQLDSQSILATASRKAAWAIGAYTYVDVEEGRRMESRNSKPESVEVKPDHVTFRGIKLNVPDGFAPLASEDWDLCVEGDELVWKVTRTWLTTTRIQRSGMPALFMGFHAPFFKNSTVSTYWYDPDYIAGRFDPIYDLPQQNGTFHPRSNKTFIRDQDPWAVFKLWSNWNNKADLRLAAKGAYLYRGGGFCWLNELGTCIGDANWQRRQAGQVETCELRIGAIDKTQTGYQMQVTLPDKELEQTLTGFYSSLLNGGAVAEHETYAFGNESDGYMTGSIIAPMIASAVAVGVPATSQLSKHPFTVLDALRQELDAIYSTVNAKEGLERYAYNRAGNFLMMNLEVIDAVKDYLLHTGDLTFIETNIGRMERQMEYFRSKLNADGLYVQAKVEGQPAWYYDVLHHNGISAFINSQLYRALGSLAEIEHALGRETQAGEYCAIADRLKEGFNKVLWRENLPGGPRYVDWITVEGKEITYFCDLCQYPPVAYGIASSEQAKKLLNTADKRLEELAKIGYQGYATPTALWPIPDELCAYDWQKNTANPFGFYFNGGHLLNSTYYELMARAAAGDSQGLYNRLSKFAALIRKNGAVGSNWVDWHGNPGFAGIYDITEPYLADMIHVTAAVTEGLLGIHPTWDRLEVKPCLPEGWQEASAMVLYLGKPCEVTIKNGKITIKTTNLRAKA